MRYGAGILFKHAAESTVESPAESTAESAAESMISRLGCFRWSNPVDAGRHLAAFEQLPSDVILLKRYGLTLSLTLSLLMRTRL